jgi:hypothetical protein
MPFFTPAAYKDPLSGMYAYKNAYGCQVPTSSVKLSLPRDASPRRAPDLCFASLRTSALGAASTTVATDDAAPFAVFDVAHYYAMAR